MIPTMKQHYRYYPVFKQLENMGLYVTCVGHHTTLPGDEFPSRTHPDEYYFTWECGRTLGEWQLGLLARGSGIIEFKNTRYRTKAGSLSIIPPNCWHRFRPDAKTGWTTYWVGFKGELANRFAEAAGFNLNGEVRDFSDNDPLRRIFASTISDMLIYAEQKPLSAAASIPMLIATIAEATSSNQPGSRASILTAQTYITDHQTETIDFEELARSLNIPYRTFRFQFRKEIGCSPLRYQLKQRLTRAKNLLASSNMSVKDIAETLGFNSTWYFAHFFQKHTSCSPATYRKRYRQFND